MRINRYLEETWIVLDTLRSHKMRSALTVLGVIIGVVTLIVIASLLTGMRHSIVALVEQMGVRNIYAFHLTTGPQLTQLDRREWQRKPLTAEDAEAIREGASAVEAVSYYGFLFEPLKIRYQDKTYRQARLQGISHNHADLTNLSLGQGRFLTEVDDRRRNPVAVIGRDVANALFPGYDSAVGKGIQIEGNRFVVVGTLEKSSTTVLGVGFRDSMVFIPYRTFQKHFPPVRLSRCCGPCAGRGTGPRCYSNRRDPALAAGGSLRFRKRL